MKRKPVKYFHPCERMSCKIKSSSRHFHSENWKEYWGSLSDTERQSLEDKASWEHMSLSAIAMEYGAHE